MAEEKQVMRAASGSWKWDEDREVDELMAAGPSLRPLWTVCAAIILTVILVALHMA